MRRLSLLCAAVVLLAGCASDAPTAARPSTSTSPSSAVASPSASPIPADAVTVALPTVGDVARATASDGWPVYVVGRADGTAEAFGAIATVGPDRVGDEVGWCHAIQLFEATTPGRRYDDHGRSTFGGGGLVRYAADVVSGTVVIGARGDQVTEAGPATTSPPCARRALLTPDYPVDVPLTAAAAGASRPVRIAGVLVIAEGQPARICAKEQAKECGDPVGLPLAVPLEAERQGRSRVTVARTLWVTVKDGAAADVAYGSVAPPDDDVSEAVQFGYLTKVEGDWIYFDRAEILLGDAAAAAAKVDGVTLPGEGEHYLRNVSHRLRRYRIDPDTSVGIGEFSGEGRAALPALRKRAGQHFSLTLITRNGKLLNAFEELCGDGG